MSQCSSRNHKKYHKIISLKEKKEGTRKEEDRDVPLISIYEVTGIDF